MTHIYIYGTPPQAKVLLLYHDIYNSLWYCWMYGNQLFQIKIQI